MNGHAKKEASTKNSSSLANLRNVMTGQPEPSPRKTVSHEGFQKSNQISNSSSNSGGSAGITATGSSSSTSDNVAKGVSSANNSNPGVSAFSYLKARLFGSSADSSITTSTSKEPFLKKGNEMNKGIPYETPFGNPGAVNSGQNSQAIESSPNQYGASSVLITGSPPTSPSNHRFFSRTLPGRRQPQSESQPASGKHTALLPIDQTISSTPHEIPPPSASSNGVNTSRSAYGTQDRSSALSHSTTQKHLSTGSLIFHEGYLNKKVELHTGETGHGWKVYRVTLKSSKLYFYKPSTIEERPKFQDPKDHNQNRRQFLSPNHSHHDHQGYHHQQHSSSSGIISPRLSITNECGMVLSAFNFESSTRTLLFEGNAKSINQGQTFAPPVTKYVYGECFTEIDRLTMQFKKHVALLLFEDNIVICKRKWIRYASTKVKDAIKFSSNNHEKGDSQEAAPSKRQGSVSGNSYKSGDSRGSDVEYRSRTSFDQSEKQRGYFTKWKHEATYPISQVEALDMASPVPSSSATFYPFAAPATAALGSISSIGRNPRDPETSSIYTNASISAHNTHHTTSTLELVITSFIDGKEYTQRLLYLPPSQEVRHQWYSKFNRVKELYQSRSYPKSHGRGATEAIALRDTLSPRSARTNQSSASLHSPTSPKFVAESGNFVLNSGKMDRIRAFCETSKHPDLILQIDESTGAEKLVGASVNGLIHELTFGNVMKPDTELITLMASTYQLFTTVPLILKELKRNVNVQLSSAESSENPERSASITHRIENLIRAMTKRLSTPSADMNSLEQLRTFTIEILQEKLSSAAAVDLLSDIDAALLRILTSEETAEQNNPSTAHSKDAPVDLSNVLITGLTPALFLKLEPLYFAEQVLRYHDDQLRSIGDIADLVSNPAFFMRQFPTVGKIRPQQSPLVFSMYSPHFLTVLITHHILIATQSAQSTSRRPKLLVHWIRTAQCSRSIGDLAGFIAIASGICSPGVIRLQETWKQVPQDLQLEVAQTWVPTLIGLGMITEDLQELAYSSFNLSESINNVIDLSIDGTRPVIPCISNIKQSIDHLDRTIPSFLQSNPVPILNIEKLEQIFSILQKAADSIPVNFLSSKTTFTSLSNNHIQQYFNHLASISQTLHDQYHSSELSNDAFESSLACEPHFNGQYLDYHYKNRKMTGSFIPLIFPEVIPEKRLFSQPLLLSLESTGNANRKNSFDEARTNASRVSFLKQDSELPSSSMPIPEEWTDHLATHHGTTQSNLTGISTFPGSRMRTYSFPPSRSAVRDSDMSSQIINMINPHLVAVACGCLSDTDGSESNEIIMAMRSISGIGYYAITAVQGRIVLKAKEDSIATLVKGFVLEGDSRTDSDFQKPSTNWNSTGIPGSNRSSCSISNVPRMVMVKAGTLESLIHVAVLGLEDQNGKFFDEKGSRQLALNQKSFMKAFFATFRSFCTVGRLLDQLFAMFAFPQGADLRSSHSSPTAMSVFPETKRASFSALNVESNGHDSVGHDIKRAMAVQTSVLDAIEYWLGSHTGDFLDDLSHKSKLSETLKSMSAHLVSRSQQTGDSIAGDPQILMGRILEFKRFVVKQLMKPPNATGINSSIIETLFTSLPSLPPQLDDFWTVDQILDRLNTAVWAHFLTIREQEWFVLFEVLESQSADPLGWYLPKTQSSSADEDIIITGIHDTLYTIRRNGAPGTHWNGERLLHSLPLCLQNLCKLHHVIRGWIITQVASPNISYNVRLDRIQKILSVVLQSRRNMSQFGDEAVPEAQRQGNHSAIGVPSFVENAIVSALVSPESRAYSRAWVEVASGRSNSVETLEDVLSLHQERESLSQGSLMQRTNQELVPSIGWLIERMLEACCYVRDMSYESPLLVNFDKRQYIYDLIQIYTKKQDRLRNEIKSPSALSSWLGLSAGPSSDLPMKLVRETAQKEAANSRSLSTGQLPTASNIPKSSKYTKVFSRLVTFQQEKLKRDQKEFEKLEKQIKDTQGRIQKAQQEQAKSLEKQIKLEQNRSRVKNQLLKSTLMRAMRPISLAITSSWSSATTTVSNATALGSAVSGRIMGGSAVNSSVEALNAANQYGMDMHETNVQPRVISMAGSIYSTSGPKPVLVINLINSTCSVAYTYTKRDYVFKIVTEEGGQTLLQGLDYEDMLRWIKTLNDAAAEATAKRRTLLDNDEKTITVVEELPAVVENERKSRNSVFGIELRHLMGDGSIPLIVEKCITEIEKRGLDEVGIYRVPGAVSSINKLRLRFNSGSQNVDLSDDEWKDINVVAGALKQFLRELPDSVMTSSLYDSLIAASALEDYDERLMTMKDLIRTLPAPNYLLLKRIIEHLERVTDFEEINHMYATNLAIVFGPTLLRPGGTSANSFATSMKNLGHQQNIVRNMILQYHWLFDVEAEEGGAEVEEDDDEEELGEFPDIMEEDSEDGFEGDELAENDDGDDDLLVLTESQPTSVALDAKEADKDGYIDKSAKRQHRKTIVFG